jgi:hypothetical protein
MSLIWVTRHSHRRLSSSGQIQGISLNCVAVTLTHVTDFACSLTGRERHRRGCLPHQSSPNVPLVDGVVLALSHEGGRSRGGREG